MMGKEGKIGKIISLSVNGRKKMNERKEGR